MIVLKELGRYALCGGMAAATDFAVFHALTAWAGVHPLAANLVSRPCGGLVSFAANRLWTFRHRSRHGKLRVQFARFWAVWVTSYVLSELALMCYLPLVPKHDLLAKALAEGTVGVVTFMLQRHWTFR